MNAPINDPPLLRPLRLDGLFRGPGLGGLCSRCRRNGRCVGLRGGVLLQLGRPSSHPLLEDAGVRADGPALTLFAQRLLADVLVLADTQVKIEGTEEDDDGLK